MPFDIGQMLGDVADPKRLTDRLASERLKDLQWRTHQANLFEDLVRTGHYPGIKQEEIDQRLHEIWGDHKGNKKTLQDHSEKVTGIRNVLDHLGEIFGPKQAVNQPITRSPFGQVTTPGKPAQAATGGTPAGEVGVSFGAPTAMGAPSKFSWPSPPPRTDWTMPSLGAQPSMSMGHKVGDIGMHQGKRVRVSAVNPDGTIDVEDMQ